jgi:hypothetical protein
MEYLTKKLKKEIMKGGIINAPRGSGKTTAIAELLQEHPDLYLSCPTYLHKRVFKNTYRHINLSNIDNRIIGPESTEGLEGAKVIYDDCFSHPNFPKCIREDNFLCAIGTMPKVFNDVKIRTIK